MEAYTNLVAENIRLNLLDADDVAYFTDIVNSLKANDRTGIQNMSSSMFADIDDNKDGRICFEEWYKHMRNDLKGMLGVDVDKEVLSDMFKRFDKNGNGEIDEKEGLEFLVYLFETVVGPALELSKKSD